MRGFAIQPRRWVVERTYGWLSRSRRLSKDYERKVQTSETLIQVAMIRLLLARLGRGRELEKRPPKRLLSEVTERMSNALVPELSIRDFEKSLDFYVHIVGFSVVYQREKEGFAYLRLGQAQIMIDQIDKGRTWRTAELEYPLGRGVNFQIEREEIDPLLERLKRHQIELFLPVEEKWYRKNEREVGNRQFLVQDPDGYLLRFTEDLGVRPLQQGT